MGIGDYMDLLMERFMKMKKHNLKPDMQTYGHMKPDTRKYKIIRNASQCKHCGDIIESTYRHDFILCPLQSAVCAGGWVRKA